MVNFQTDILIIGGGLAGLTAALHLQQAGLEVILVEKNTYPHHKVCGEYISNEVLPYLKWLDADPEVLLPTAIKRLHFSTLSGRSMTTSLPLGGFGLSRYSLDHFLYQKFISKGGTVIHDTVVSVNHENDFRVMTQDEKQISAKQVIGAYGKRAAIDIKLKRGFMQHKSPFLAVKAHYSGEFCSDIVGLHNFSGGYCGISKVENEKINICYLADYPTFKKYKNITAYQQQVLYQNRHLEKIFESCNLLFEAPLTISQLSFGTREAVTGHILMIGDTAGLIHPLCGNGMSMAIHSAKICSELLIQFFRGTIKSKAVLEKLYISSWNAQFKSRLKMGNTLSAILKKERLADVVLSGMLRVPSLLPLIIKKTHGKTLTVNE
ncbi:NAD(P)/FAD-dependent oxidoreductase [Pedobacter sp. L105]|uniref:NAD(P)/FAD-dependent oxidoreductase n=1 Tax=Pedobacter sp. L105 TaxID=1641871 RepID=UPI00131D1D05|nr:NAD(P)/FAD-dependent oxidoreductase [Pedobacter sp. L105]